MRGVDISRDGQTVYVADTGNNRVRAIILASKAVVTLAGSGVRQGVGRPFGGGPCGGFPFEAVSMLPTLVSHVSRRRRRRRLYSTPCQAASHHHRHHHHRPTSDLHEPRACVPTSVRAASIVYRVLYEHTVTRVDIPQVRAASIVYRVLYEQTVTRVYLPELSYHIKAAALRRAKEPKEPNEPNKPNEANEANE